LNWRIRWLWAVAFPALSVFSCSSGIPQRVDGWRVEVGPPGNEFHQAPPPPEKAPPPSPALLDLVERIAPPHTEVRRWELQGKDRYFIRAEAGPEEYDFLITPERQLLLLDYENDLTNVREDPGRMVLPGSKRELPLSKIPKKTLGTLAALFPEDSPLEAWSVSTAAGPRDVAVVAGLAFFLRPDGQIQAAGPVDSALKEVDPNAPEGKTAEEILAEAAELLGAYRQRFDLRSARERLKSSGSRAFCFVVMGDSRSNPELWTAMVKHIGLLEPKPAFIINTGDIVRYGYAEEYREYFAPPLTDLDIPFFVAIGNHDDGDNGHALEYRYLFGEDSLNYVFDYNNWRFVIVDNSSSASPAGETLAWLEKVLSETPAGYSTVVAAHKPIASVEKWAYHSWDPENSARFADLMSRHMVSHVFFGHIHAYSTAEFQGVPYTISGGGGAALHDRYGPTGNVHHYVICDVGSDGIMKQQVVRFYRAEDASGSKSQPR